MVLLGMVVTVVAVGGAAVVVLENEASASFTLLGTTVPGVASTGYVFGAGFALGALFIVGLTMISSGIRRAARNRQELYELREAHEDSVAALVEEKRRLARELARVRSETQQAHIASQSAPQTHIDGSRIAAPTDPPPGYGTEPHIAAKTGSPAYRPGPRVNENGRPRSPEDSFFFET